MSIWTYERCEISETGGAMTEVLVDTTVWIDFFRRTAAPAWRPTLVDLLERDAVVLIDPIIAELLYGVRTDQERAVVLDLAGGTRAARVDRDTWIASGDLGRLWRSRGRTLSLVDCVIATVAMRERCALWTLEEDFAPLVSDGSLLRFVPG
jgi:predicted nucleic acid-binding protein